MSTFIPNVTDVFPEPSLYTPDFSFMDNMLRRRQSMYDQGFAQVNSAYNFVNRDMTNQANVKSRDAFLKQAKDNLKGLSAMDLSQSGNVQAANAVFTPFTQNEDALGDAAITEHWKQQDAIGEGYRNQDGGKYFNQANVDYVRKQRAAFANDSPKSWKDYYANKRSYSQYYDYHEEIQNLMKNFKPSTSKVDRINGMYIVTSENESWTNAEIRKYLDANLSDKAKLQMRIEGDVKYNNDPKQLGQTYKSMAQNEIAQFDKGLEFVNHKLISETNPDKIADLKQYQSNLLDKKKEISNNIANIDKGDFSYIKKIGETLAGNIYNNEIMGKVSNGFSHNNIVSKISADEIGKEIYSQGQQNMRQLRGFAHEEKMAQMKGDIPAPPTLGTVMDVDNVFDFSQASKKADEFKAEADGYDVKMKQMAVAWIHEKNEEGSKNVTVDNITPTQMVDYRNHGNFGNPLPANHPFKKYESLKTTSLNQAEHYNDNLNTIRNDIMQSYTPEQKAEIEKHNSIVAQAGIVTVSPDNEVVETVWPWEKSKIAQKTIPTSLSGSQILAAVQSGEATINMGGDWASPTNKSAILTINGKRYTADLTPGHVQQNPELYNLLKTVNTALTSDAYTKYNKDVKTYLDKYPAQVSTSNIMSFDKKSRESKTLTGQLESVLPESNFDVQLRGIGGDEYSQGSAYFYITPKKDANGTVASNEDIAAHLKGLGYNDVHVINPSKSVSANVVPGSPVLFQIKNFKSPILDQYRMLSPLEQTVAQVSGSEAAAGVRGTYTTRPYTSESSRRLQIKHDHGDFYLMVEGLHGGNTMDRIDTPFNKPIDAILYGKKLTKTEMIGNMPVQEAELKQLQYLLNK